MCGDAELDRNSDRWTMQAGGWWGSKVGVGGSASQHRVPFKHRDAFSLTGDIQHVSQTQVNDSFHSQIHSLRAQFRGQITINDVCAQKIPR